MKLHTVFLCAALLVTVSTEAFAHGQTLRAAMESAYRSNPTLASERATTRRVNEQLRERVGAALPQVSGTLSTDATYQRTYNPRDYGESFGASASLDVSQPLFRGGATAIGVRLDELGAQIQWATLAATEVSIMNQIAQNYIQLAKQQALAGQYSNQVEVQNNQLAAAQARYEFGEGTLTDIAQARARRAVAQASVQQARASANSAKATLRQLIGREITTASVPHFPFNLPSSEAAAIEAAQSFSPSVIASRRALALSELQRELTRTSGRPTVDLTGSARQSYSDWRRGQAAGSKSVSVGVTARIPLYQGGQVRSQIEQASFAIIEAQNDFQSAKDQARQQASSAWSQLRSARAVGGSFAAQRDAAALQLEGARAELDVGTKTFLDVLDAEQVLQEANVGLVNARYDEVAAAYSLFAAMGRLNAYEMKLGVTPFDAEADYQRVRQILDQVGRFVPALRFNNSWR